MPLAALGRKRTEVGDGLVAVREKARVEGLCVGIAFYLKARGLRGVEPDRAHGVSEVQFLAPPRKGEPGAAFDAGVRVVHEEEPELLPRLGDPLFDPVVEGADIRRAR